MRIVYLELRFSVAYHPLLQTAAEPSRDMQQIVTIYHARNKIFTLLVTASKLMQFVIGGAGRARTSFVPVANTSSFIGCHWAAVMPDTH